MIPRITSVVRDLGGSYHINLVLRESNPGDAPMAQSIAIRFPDMEAIRTVVSTLQDALVWFDARRQEDDQ